MTRMSAVGSTLFVCLLSAGVLGFSGCDADHGTDAPASHDAIGGMGVEINTGEPDGQHDGTLREAMRGDEGTEIKVREDGVDIQVD